MIHEGEIEVSDEKSLSEERGRNGRKNERKKEKEYENKMKIASSNIMGRVIKRI